MTATEKLRVLLDERGVEYEVERIDFSNYFTWGENDCYSYTEYPDGTVLRIWDCTPEQAIATTLGRGTCHMEQIPECRYDDIECNECGICLWGFSWTSQVRAYVQSRITAHIADGRWSNERVHIRAQAVWL